MVRQRVQVSYTCTSPESFLTTEVVIPRKEMSPPLSERIP